MEFWKLESLLKFCKMGSINLAYVVPKLAQITHMDFIENVVK